MLRRNLLKSLTAIIPFSFIGKNANANLLETTNCEEIDSNVYFKNKSRLIKIDPDQTWEIVIKNKNGKTIKIERSDGWWFDCTYDEHGNQLSWKDNTGRFYEYEYDENGTQHTVKRILPC